MARESFRSSNSNVVHSIGRHFDVVILANRVIADCKLDNLDIESKQSAQQRYWDRGEHELYSVLRSRQHGSALRTWSSKNTLLLFFL